MKDYLNIIIRHCLQSRRICENIIEEVNDGSLRNTFVVSASESYYNCCILLRTFYRSCPDEFTPSMRRRMLRAMSYSPECHIKRKLAMRAGIVSDDFENLPF